jgi:hypothetical protein
MFAMVAADILADSSGEISSKSSPRFLFADAEAAAPPG